MNRLVGPGRRVDFPNFLCGEVTHTFHSVTSLFFACEIESKSSKEEFAASFGTLGEGIPAFRKRKNLKDYRDSGVQFGMMEVLSLLLSKDIGSFKC